TVELRRLDRLEREVTLHQTLDARGVVELRPLGAQRRGRLAHTLHVGTQLGDALGLQGRVELDLVDMDRRAHEHRDDDEVEKAQGRPLSRSTSASDGGRGSAGRSALSAGALVRSAARSLAERARGLAAVSPASGPIGRLVSKVKLAGRAATSGR